MAKKWFLLHHSFVTRNLLYNADSINVILYINDELAAFMSGFRGDKGQYVVPRLSIDERFKFYSPGMLLINETIKYLLVNTDIRHLDLAIGEEQYKYKMGGKVHYSHNFEINLKNLDN